MNALAGDFGTLVLGVLPCPLCIWDAEDRLAYVNEAGRGFLNVDATLLPLGMPMREAVRLFAHRGVYGPGDPEALAGQVMALDRSRPIRRLIRPLDGTVREWHGVPLPGGGFCSALLDVSALMAPAAESEARARQLRDVLDRLHNGLALYSAGNRLVLHNPAFETLCGAGRGTLAPGMSHAEVLDLLIARGEYGNLDAEEWRRERRALDRSKPHVILRDRPDGTTVRLDSQPTADGGWLVEMTDVTAVRQAEAEAQRRAAMLDGVLASLPLGVMVLGPDQRITMLNAAYHEIMAGAPAEVGQHRADLARRRAEAGEYGPGEVEALVRQNLSTMGATAIRRRVRPNGQVIETRTAPMPFGGGVHVVADITALHRAEAEATARAAQMRAMQDHMRHGIALFDAEERLVSWNALAAPLIGLPPESLRAGRTIVELVEEQAALGEFGPLREERLQAAHALHGQREVPARHTRRRPDGTVLEVARDPIPGGGFVYTYSDVTPLARAEEAAQVRADMLQTTLDSMRHGIALYGPDGRLKLANDLAGDLSGLGPGVLVPGVAFAAVLDQYVERGLVTAEVAAQLKAVDRGQPFSLQRLLPDRRSVDVTSAPTPDGGFVLTFTDVSARAKAEQEAQQRANMLQAIFDNVRQGIALFGPDHRLIAANELAGSILEIEPGWLKPGVLHADIIAHQAANGAYSREPDVAGRIAWLLAQDRSKPLRYQRRTGHGLLIDVLSDPTPDGGFCLTVTDVTPLAAAEEAAQRNAAVLRATLDSVRHGIAMFGADGRLISANALAGPEVGLPPLTERIGRSFAEIMQEQAASGVLGPPEEAAAFVARGVATDRSRSLRYLRRRPDGKMVEITSNPTCGGGFILTYTDVTEREETRAEAERRAAMIQAMLDNTRHGMALYGPDRRLLVANHLAEDLSGMPQGTLRPGRTQDEMLVEQYENGAFGSGPEAEEYLARMRARDWSQPLRTQRRDGRGRLIDVASTPMADGGFVLTRTDVTELVAASEEAARRGRTLQVMLDSIRHGVAYFGPDRRLIALNHLTHQLAGSPPVVPQPGATLDELICAQLAKPGLAEDPDRRAMIERALAHDRSKPLRYVRSTPEGRSIEVASDPTPDGGFVITHTDVTELLAAQQAAADRAALLQTMMDHMRHGIARFDAGRRLVAANGLAGRMHGMDSMDMLTGMLETEIIELLQRRGYVDEAAVRACHEADIRTSRQYTHRRPDGRVITFRADPTPDGGYVATYSDVTELLAAQEEAARRAGILQVMLDNIRHGICYYGPDRRIIAANRLASVLGGHGEGELRPGRSLDELIDEQIASGAVPPAARHIAERARTLDRSLPAHHLRPTGDGRVLDVTSDPTPDGGFVVTSTDITRLARAEEMAQHRAAVLGVMLDNIRHGIVLFDAERKLVMANPRVREMLDVPDAALVHGTPHREYIRLLHENGTYGTGPEADAMAREALASFDPAVPLRRLKQRPNGMVVEVVSDPTPDGGFVLVYTDVTQDRRFREELERAKDAAEAANRAKSRFLATITHELRTPLNAVIGFSEAVMAGTDPAQAKEFLGSIHEAGRHLLSLIDDILDVVRSETSGFQIAETTVDITALAEGAVRVMRAAAASAGVNLAAEIAPGLPAVRADEVRLRQVLLNLLSNAVKFTPRGGQVTLRLQRDAAGAVELRVSDTGIGMKPEDIPRAFEPFTQLDSSLSRRYQGSGLGLYLSRALAEAQGAALGLESAEGAGTTAVLRFPATRLLPLVTA